MADNSNRVFSSKERELIGSENVVASAYGSILGSSLQDKTRKRIIVTDSRIILFDPKKNGSLQAMIPYIELTGVNYTNRKGTLGTFTVNTRSGSQKMDIDNADDREAIDLIDKLKERIEQIAGVAVPLTNINGLLSQSWGFHTPTELSTMVESTKKEQNA